MQQTGATPKECVILVHGYGGLTPASIMKPSMEISMARKLRREGYEVLTTSYFSRLKDMDAIVARIHQQIEPFLEAHPGGAVHFVGHSMGGRVIASYLQKHPLDREGRVVMLGTPNQGHFLAEKKLLQKIGGDVVRQMDPSRPPVPIEGREVGVIAGEGNPLLYSLLGGDAEPSDGVVSVRSTHLAGAAHRVIETDHVHMLFNEEVFAEMLLFLKTGDFSPSSGLLPRGAKSRDV